MTTLVLKLHPSVVEGQIPCLPAHLLFMCLRYADHVQNEHQVTMLLEGIIKGVQQVCVVCCVAYVCICVCAHAPLCMLCVCVHWVCIVCYVCTVDPQLSNPHLSVPQNCK